MRETGKVKSFDTSKGFGFITSTKGENVFFHHSSISGANGFKELKEGESVEFDKEDGPKGPRASNVVKIV